MDLAQLIDKAAAAVGHQSKLATMLGVRATRLSDWKHSRVTCPLHAQARIAQLAGEDWKAWVCEEVAKQMGRAAAAVLLALAVTLAAIGAHGADGARLAGSRR